jgi:hypothetical protein
MDIEIKIDVSEAEKTLLSALRIPFPGDGRSSSQDTLRSIFASQGDLYREVGVRNFRAFQPDWVYFNSSSNGWVKFVNKLATEENRDELLQRIAQVVAAKIKLMVKRVPPASYVLDITTPGPAEVPVSFVDLTGSSLDIRIGNKILRCTKIVEDAEGSELIDSTIGEIKAQAETKLDSYQSECAHNLELMKKQYEKQIADLNTRYSSSVVALTLPMKVLQADVQYNANHPSKKHEFWIPIQLEYKYISTGNNRWELMKKYQLKQNGYLFIQTDTSLNVCYGFIYDEKRADTIQLWHSSGGICWGSYVPKITKLEDLLKIRDDVQQLLTTINVRSVAPRNLSGNQAKLNEVIRNPGFDVVNGIEDYDYSSVATVVDKKNPEAGGKEELWQI